MRNFTFIFVCLSTLFIVSCMNNSTQNTPSGDSVVTDSRIIDNVNSSLDVEQEKTPKKAEKDTLGILSFYETHNMDSLSQHFDTLATTEFISSINGDALGDYDNQRVIVYDGEGVLDAYFDPENTLTFLHLDLAAGDGSEIYDFWLEYGKLIYCSMLVKADASEDIDEKGNEITYGAISHLWQYYFMDNKLVMRIHDNKILPFKKDDFYDDNKYILSQLQDLEKALKTTKETE